jgi:hypothetical protein
MKNFKFTLTFLLLLVGLAVSAQDTIYQDTISQDSVMREKLKFAGKLILANGHKQAFQIYSECASEGSAYAMNAIGILKQRG